MAAEPRIAMRLGGQFYLAHRYARAATNERLKAQDIDLRHLAVLAELAERGPSKQRELVDRIKMDKSSMVYVLDRLEARGLAERRRDAQDRRSHAVIITARGRSLLSAATRGANQAMEELLTGLSARDKQQLSRLLSKFLNGLTGFADPINDR